MIVSNFDEMRLYRADNATNFERVMLSDITTHRDLHHLQRALLPRVAPGCAFC